MFSGKAGADQELMQRVLAACEGLAGSPLLVGTAPDADTHAAMMGMAEAAGLSYLPACTAPRHNYTAIWAVVSDLVQRTGAPPNSAWELSKVPLVP